MSGEGAQGAVEFTLTYTEEEYLSAARAFLWRRRDPKFERILIGVFFALLVVIFALAGDPYAGGVMVTVMLAVLAGGYFAYRMQPRKYLPRDPQMREPFRVSFAEEGIRVGATNFKTTYDWKYFPKLLETPEFFFFIYNEEMYFLVPKRVLGKRQEPVLRELLRRKFGARMETQGLPEARDIEREYVPPSEPPDWR